MFGCPSALSSVSVIYVSFCHQYLQFSVCAVKSEIIISISVANVQVATTHYHVNHALLSGIDLFMYCSQQHESIVKLVMIIIRSQELAF